MTTGGKALGVVMSEQDFDSINVSGNATIGGTLTAAAQSLSGGQIGTSSTSLISFYGATVTTQPATIAAVTTASLTSVTTDAATTSTPWGYATSTQADALVTLVNALAVRATALTTQGNSLRSADVTLGLVAAS